MARSHRVFVVWVSIVLTLAAAPRASFAAPASESPAAVADQTFRFEIPHGALDAAIAAFEALTGRRVSTPPDLTVSRLSSPGVTGTYPAEEALEHLLRGTGLGFRLADANTSALEVRRISETVDVSARLPSSSSTSMMATKTLTPLRDVPQSVTVITQTMIAEQGMQSMADVVRYVPGVGMGQGEGNRDTPVLRGNSSTADFFIDGVRDDVQYFRDLYNVERVEALKGPNAMIFGRGGAGGVINRVTRQADWSTGGEASVQAGSHDNRRIALDLGRPINPAVAARLTGMYENSGSYRRGVRLERYGVNPTLAFMLGDATPLRISYEYFHDDRTADRGIPSFGDRPVATSASTFFGDPGLSNSVADVNAATSVLDHAFRNGLLLKNRTHVAAYDKFYQNIYPGAAVSADGTTASLAAYNNATGRRNVFNQTDITLAAATGGIRHLLLAGAEIGRQTTENFRETGYFTSMGPNATSYSVPVSAPSVSVPVAFRQSATDADNHSVATVSAVYAQDQLELSSRVQAIVGVRVDRFDVDARNNRTHAEFTSTDSLVSPRAGLVFKPREPMSLYASYSLAYLPRAGEQLSSLSLTNQALDPEKFTNYEIGAKWDIRPAISMTSAFYRLNRTNVAIADPVDPTRTLLVAGQRTSGVELGLTGTITRKWNAVASYAYQDGTIAQTLSATARAGARLAQLPAHSFSLWNRYNVAPRLGVGLGVIHSADIFTSTDNLVTLPSFTRVDAAVFSTISRQVRLQANIENLLDAHYYAFAHNNVNITPGAPRSVRVTLVVPF
jgi:catecholate siderophore receptor